MFVQTDQELEENYTKYLATRNFILSFECKIIWWD